MDDLLLAQAAWPRFTGLSVGACCLLREAVFVCGQPTTQAVDLVLHLVSICDLPPQASSRSKPGAIIGRSRLSLLALIPPALIILRKLGVVVVGRRFCL
jgi:hypothetical protein